MKIGSPWPTPFIAGKAGLRQNFAFSSLIQAGRWLLCFIAWGPARSPFRHKPVNCLEGCDEASPPEERGPPLERPAYELKGRAGGSIARFPKTPPLPVSQPANFCFAEHMGRRVEADLSARGPRPPRPVPVDEFLASSLERTKVGAAHTESIQPASRPQHLLHPRQASLQSASEMPARAHSCADLRPDPVARSSSCGLG